MEVERLLKPRHVMRCGNKLTSDLGSNVLEIGRKIKKIFEELFAQSFIK